MTSPEKVNASVDERLAGLLDGMEEEPALGRAFEARFQTVLQLSREDLFWSQQPLTALRASEAELSAGLAAKSRFDHPPTATSRSGGGACALRAFPVALE